MAMPVNIMEEEEAPPENQAGVEDVEMTEIELTMQAAATAAPAAGAAAVPPMPQEFIDAAAAIKVERVEEEEEGELVDTQETEQGPGGLGPDGAEGDSEDGGSEAEDLTTQYHHVIDTVSGLDNAWLSILKSYQDDDLQSRYRWEAFEQWNKLNKKAVEINAELAKRGQPPLPPAKMFLQVYEHLSSMGLGILSDREHETGCANPDLLDQLMQSLKDHDRESKRVANEKKVANVK